MAEKTQSPEDVARKIIASMIGSDPEKTEGPGVTLIASFIRSEREAAERRIKEAEDAAYEKAAKVATDQIPVRDLVFDPGPYGAGYADGWDEACKNAASEIRSIPKRSGQ